MADPEWGFIDPETGDFVGVTEEGMRRRWGDLDAAWAALHAVLPEGWTVRLVDFGDPGPFNPGPGHSLHVPRYEAGSKDAILSSPPTHWGRSDESLADAIRALTAVLAEGAG